ncbi:hypothetical protein TorRG33x02_219180 [Trema orientale]|uniref:Uncharacterized protein n=1 Tax=Trema orientale TaxID=63057 RepID=A0A2P5E9S7_TREOI|nr:hypothetical protein TorRG33x02_219180 [Trema orientale]
METHEYTTRLVYLFNPGPIGREPLPSSSCSRSSPIATRFGSTSKQFLAYKIAERMYAIT